MKKNLLIKLFESFIILFFVWMVVSYLQIVLFNLSENPYEHYSSWNMFLLMADLYEIIH